MDVTFAEQTKYFVQGQISISEEEDRNLFFPGFPSLLPTPIQHLQPTILSIQLASNSQSKPQE